MRVVLLGVLGALGATLGACDEAPVLRVNVHVMADEVYVSVRERDRDCGCSSGNFAAPGECVSYWSDAIHCGCDPDPGWCVERMWIEREGAVIPAPENMFGSPAYGTSFLLGANDLMLDSRLVIEGCGGTASVPIGGLPQPSATITSVVAESPAVTLAWEMTPAGTSAIATIADISFVGGDSCHVVGSETYTFPAAQYWAVIDLISVAAAAGPVVHDTPIGGVSVWSGARDLRLAR